MSWQSYITSILGSNFVQKAAIHGLDGSTWATSPGFAVTPDEAKALAKASTDPSGLYSGIFLQGTKYTFVRQDERSTYGRKGSDSGCVIVKTKQAILIGVYEAGVQAGNCNTVVEKMADYLISVGY
eukprot:m.221170 g.221170  ORF g.221170 m.221170 type:complete len:126 (+) comp15734_c0_seq1:87-464(+)